MRLVTNVHSTSPTGGVELNVFQVSRELARRGHQVDLLYRQPGSLVPDYRKFCRSVTRVPEVDYWYPTGRRGRPRQMARVVPAVAAAIRRRPDLIYGNRIMSTGWAVPAGKVAGAPVVCHEHGHSDHLSRRRIDRLGRHVDRFVMVSQFVGRPVARPRDWTPTRSRWSSTASTRRSTRWAVTRSGRRPVRRCTSTTGRSLSPTSVGSTARRGCTSCSRPGATSTSAPDEATLVVVGSSTVAGDAARYQAELRALATDSVRFLPGRSDVVTPCTPPTWPWCRRSWQEPFGRTVIEALSTGRPVVASRVGWHPRDPDRAAGPFPVRTGGCRRVGRAARSASSTGGTTNPELAGLCRGRVLEQFTLPGAVDGVEAAFRRCS